MAKATTTVKKYLLMKSLHLGHVRESFSAGAVIEHDEEGGFLKIDGRKFDNTEDLRILLNHDWAVPYSKQALAKLQGETVPIREDDDEDGPEIRSMKVVKSDADLMSEDIDISHTVNRPEERAPKKAAEEMEIIKGDETPEERVRRLQRTLPKLPIVQDDSLGYGDSKASALNAGTVEIKTAEEHEAMRQEALAKQVSKTIKKAGKRKAGRPKGSKDKKPRAAKKAVRKPKKLKLDATDEFAGVPDDI